MIEFDDGRLDDPVALAAADAHLRFLAQAGARLRTEWEAATEPLAVLPDMPRPRAVIALGSEARFLRAVLEPVCPVPFVAWPGPGLPGWVGPLDIVAVIGAEDSLLSAVHEASRRGCYVIWSAPPGTRGTELLDRSSTLLPSQTGDPLAAAIVMMSALHAWSLGSLVRVGAIADAMDAVATACSVHEGLVTNPAKSLASDLADGQPLVCGASVLSARAARRIAEALRRASGRVVLAADAAALAPVVLAASPRDPFADPFADGPTEERPMLLVVEDGTVEHDPHLDYLLKAASAQDVRVSRISHLENGPVERYATILQEGLFAAVYLQVGLGRPFA